MAIVFAALVIEVIAGADALELVVPAAIYLTHYSRVTGIGRLAADLHADLDAFVAIARAHPEVDAIRDALGAHLRARLTAHGCTLAAAEIDALLELDVRLNAQGLVAWRERAAR